MAELNRDKRLKIIAKMIYKTAMEKVETGDVPATILGVPAMLALMLDKIHRYGHGYEDEIINLATDAMFALELSIDWGAIVSDANKDINDELDREELDEESTES